MPLVLPTADEYAEMSWHARQHVVQKMAPVLDERRRELRKQYERVRREHERARRRERHQWDAMLWSESVRMEAELWYESLPADDPELIAERRAVLERDYGPRR